MGGIVEVIDGKGCPSWFLEFSSSFRGLQSNSSEPSSPASSASTLPESPVKAVNSNGPFSGLVVCVTGHSKEARKHVKEATERLGGQYSPHLHPHCTHLVVQSIHGNKFKHALKHGPTNGLFLVTISWFVDSVRRNVRLNESLYRITVGKMGDWDRFVQNGCVEKSCLPIGSLEHAKKPEMKEGRQSSFSERDAKRIVASPLSGHSCYIDTDISTELYSKPLWVLETAKEKHPSRVVHLSADLARNIGTILDITQNRISSEVEQLLFRPGSVVKGSQEKRQNIADLTKEGIRKRRGNRMLTCQTPIRPITPGSLLDSISWSISEPTSTASIYTDSLRVENVDEDQMAVFFDANGDGKDSDASFVNLSQPLKESEKSELIFKSPFLTVLFPVDRFSELGPNSRTFFSNKGFTCLQALDHIYTFYQENMSAEEIEVAIHTDSRHADRLRAAYSSKQNVVFKRIDFLGSRKSFEMLKRVPGDNSSNVYELLIRA